MCPLEYRNSVRNRESKISFIECQVIFVKLMDNNLVGCILTSIPPHSRGDTSHAKYLVYKCFCVGCLCSLRKTE